MRCLHVRGVTAAHGETPVLRGVDLDLYPGECLGLVGDNAAGKSTLTNALVGDKVAITSSKPQTTRHTIRGIVTREHQQLVLVDTPGLHKPRTLLGSRLNDLVVATLSAFGAGTLVTLVVPQADGVLSPFADAMSDRSVAAVGVLLLIAAWLLTTLYRENTERAFRNEVILDAIAEKGTEDGGQDGAPAEEVKINSATVK